MLIVLMNEGSKQKELTADFLYLRGLYSPFIEGDIGYLLPQKSPEFINLHNIPLSCLGRQMSSFSAFVYPH